LPTTLMPHAPAGSRATVPCFTDGPERRLSPFSPAHSVRASAGVALIHTAAANNSAATGQAPVLAELMTSPRLLSHHDDGEKSSVIWREQDDAAAPGARLFPQRFFQGLREGGAFSRMRAT
jgi:hypothetical protein